MEGTNTLLVIVVVILLAFGAFWLIQNNKPATQDNTPNVELKVGADQPVN